MMNDMFFLKQIGVLVIKLSYLSPIKAKHNKKFTVENLELIALTLAFFVSI